MNIVCSICARGGSKGFKNKNIADLLGRPVLAWSIQHAREVAEISSIFVSTDSDDIMRCAIDWGAEVLFRRPSELASDTAAKWDVWRHALVEYERIKGEKVDVLIDLDCTSPLREPSDIKAALEQFIDSGADLVFSVCEARKNPYFNLVEPTASGLRLSKQLTTKIVRRQDVPPVFEHVASIYVIRRDYLLSASGMLEGRALGYDIGPAKSFDIDTELDFKIISMLLSEKS